MNAKSLAWMIPILLLTAGSFCLPLTFTVTQGSNQFTVNPFILGSASFDLFESVADPKTLSLRASRISSPYDESAGLLHDGNLYFFKIERRGKDIASFYDYNTVFGSSANTGLEISEETHVFLCIEEKTGGLYLVVIHDVPNDADGGIASWSFAGLPPTTTLAVEDDPQGFGDDYVLDAPNGTLQISWAWLPCCTDGVAIGGLEGTEFTIEITPSFGIGWGGQILTMAFLGGTPQSPDRFPMERDTPFTITAKPPVEVRRQLVTLFVTKNRSADTVTFSWR
jgi:hypothetical protein